VSPLWRDEVGVHLAPRRLTMVRLKRGTKPKLVVEHVEAFEPAESADWSGALTVLDTLLAQPQWRGALLRVVLADCWARYAIVPWVAELSTANEQIGHARQLLASTYGDAVSDWDVRLSDGRPDLPRVACTMPATLLEGVRSTCVRQGVKLASVQPQLVAAYESWRARLPASGAWFVCIDEGSLAAARITSKGWDRVRSVRIGTDWARELKRLQTFGRLTSANPNEGQVYVDAPMAWREAASPAAKGLQWLEDEGGGSTTLQRLGRARRFAT
jgi:hypothetical protein